MLIATDLDGTLVPDGSATLPPYTAEVLRRADRADVPIVFVTARPLRWMDALWPHVGRHGLAIVSNGAVTYDVGAREVVHLAGIEPEPGLTIAAAVTEAVSSASFALECLDGMRLDPAFDEPYPVPAGTPRGPLDRVWDAPAVKMLVRYDGEQLPPREVPRPRHDGGGRPCDGHVVGRRSGRDQRARGHQGQRTGPSL